MNDESSQEKRFNLEEFSKKSDKFYNRIKEELEPKFKGKYVALDFESERYWIGDTATEALTNAKKEFPKKIFYFLQIGSPSAFNIQSVRTHSPQKLKYDFARQY